MTRLLNYVNLGVIPYNRILLGFEDEAGFGRINKPRYCWCEKGVRPSVPCHHIREYRYAYGTSFPQTGDLFSLILPYCNTVCMNLYLDEMSKYFARDYLVLAMDGATWHRSKGLQIPANIEIVPLPPYTPEMNPQEQIWEELRKRGFRNEIFQTLEKVVDRLSDTICSIEKETVKSITKRKWILSLC